MSFCASLKVLGDDALPVIESEDDASEEDTGMVTFYRLQRLAKPAQAGEVNRILGQPVGVAASRWPQYRGQPMHHVLTLDLDTAPELRRGRLASKLAGTRAIALFVSDTSSNEAWEPGTKESAVVLIDEAQIAANPGETSGKAMSVVAEQVPASVFGSREPEDSEEVSKRHGLGVDSYAGGGPIWLQGAEHRGSFVLQFSEELVPMNLGDGGEMYVFLDTAFWQCF